MKRLWNARAGRASQQGPSRRRRRYDVRLDALRDVLAKSDYVVLATPNTPDTFQSFGKAELNVMKPSAFLINIARGNLIQERPLYDALTSGRLRGCAADVWWRYEFGRAFPIG
ncbi:phosphoglycerate dehydrogenase-like enzyme [Bradyrhizobium japonicum]